MIPAAVELRGVSKAFGDVVANSGVNLRVERGTLHGIIGENGAGKSTAMKLLYGMYRPDAGEIWVNGRQRTWSTPAQAMGCGIGMVHQHFMLAEGHTALDNILLGAGTRRWGLIDRRGARKRLEAVVRQYGLAVDLECLVEGLTVGQQQRLEILKLLYRDAEILILDEPTAVLTPQETSTLFTNLQKLRAEGKTILLVTHKLKDVMNFTERVTVFRGGKVTGEVETAQTNPQELAELMVGRKVLLNLAVQPARPGGETGIEVMGLNLVGRAWGRPRLSDITFSVRRGEIVGLAGIEGNGQSELLQAMLHPREPGCRSSGTVKYLGQDVSDWRASEIRELGVAVIPEDRLAEGLLAHRPVFENFLLGLQRSSSFQRHGLLDLDKLALTTSRALEEYDVRPRNAEILAGHLSGGNQQKLIVAREFQRQPRVIVAAQPTRGVDVGAIEFIHRRIVQARDEGAGVLLVSSELDELLALSDRILVMYEGRLVAQFGRGEASERDLGLKMGGV